MKTVNQVILFLFVSTFVVLLTIRFAHADENPFSQPNTGANIEKQRSVSQSIWGTGRCGRCGGCGGGMMWRGDGMPRIGDINELPEPQSKGAKLVNHYCTQCHALPNPKLHSTDGWLVTIDRMNARMIWMREQGNDISAPDKKELEVLMDYLLKHAM